VADFRRLVVFKDPNSEANAFVAFTDIRPDFTTLGSFGTIRDVAKTVIPTGRGTSAASEGISIDTFKPCRLRPSRQHLSLPVPRVRFL
jgi:hypothetical protein